MTDDREQLEEQLKSAEGRERLAKNLKGLGKLGVFLGVTTVLVALADVSAVIQVIGVNNAIMGGGFAIGLGLATQPVSDVLRSNAQRDIREIKHDMREIEDRQPERGLSQQVEYPSPRTPEHILTIIDEGKLPPQEETRSRG